MATTSKKPAVKTPVNSKTKVSAVTKNRVAVLVDKSGSMAGIRDETIKFYNNLIETVRKNAKKDSQQTEVTLLYFNQVIDEVLVNEDASGLKKLNSSSYSPNGGTALFDAVAHAIDTIEKSDADDTAYAVFVLTDGEERDSKTYRTAEAFRKLIKSKQSTDVWTFAFMVPEDQAGSFGKLSGLPSGNILPWSDINTVDVEASKGVEQFYEDRRSGKTKSDNVFVKPDLSQVKKSDLNSLDNISSKVNIWRVEKEVEIGDFVREKNNGVYTKGHAFFEYTKAEDVSAKKLILIIDKDQPKKVLAKARHLAGFPTRASGLGTKFKPGNHGNFEIFGQSTSETRKLVRGTRLVYVKDDESLPTE